MKNNDKKPKIRRGWGPLNPVTRVHGKSKKRGYDRNREKRENNNQEI